MATQSVEEEVYSALPRQHNDRRAMHDNLTTGPPGAVEDHKNTVTRAVTLQWARSLAIRSGDGRKIIVHPSSREIIVKELYPRLLYTFSDVVCYVTTNARWVALECLFEFSLD